MKTSRSHLILRSLSFFALLHDSSGSGTSVKVGKTYVVPPPSEIPNLADYRNLIQQCNPDPTTQNCNWAMSQFISDLNLMLGDTYRFLNNLMQQITTDQTVASYKSSQIQGLISMVDTLSTQLMQNAQHMDISDDHFYGLLSQLQGSVAAIVNEQSSPVYAQARAEQASITSRLSALDGAVSTYLAQERAAVTDTANTVFQLFKNDQAIIQNNAGSQMKSIAGQAEALTSQISDLRGFYQGNLTEQTSNLNTQTQELIKAEASADGAVLSAQKTIASTIQAGISNAMASTATVLTNQIANVTNAIDSIRTSSYGQFDSAFQVISASNANATAKIDANISAALAAITTLSNLVTVNVQAAQAAQQNALKNLNSTQASQQSRLAQNSQTLNQSIADYTAKAASVTSSVFASSQNFMSEFANLAQSAASQAGGSMAGSATKTGDSMSTLNSYIGSMSSDAYAQSQGAAADTAKALANARQSAAMTSVAQLTALSTAVNTITALVDLLKGKMGYSSDQTGVQFSSVEQLVNASTTDLQKTINSVTAAISKKAYAAAEDAQKKLNSAANKAAQGKQSTLTQFNKIIDSLQSKISDIAVKRTNAVTVGENTASSISAMASKLASSNADLATQVNRLLSNINANWAAVTGSNKNLISAVNTSLSQLKNSATALASNQNSSSLAYIANRLTSFKTLVNKTQVSALAAQVSAVKAANTTMQSLAKQINATLNATNTLVNNTMFAANSTLNSVKAIPAVLVGMASNGLITISQSAANATATMQAKVDQVKNTLLAQIKAAGSKYLENSYSQLNPVTSAMDLLQAQLVAGQQLKQTVFPDNGMSVLKMNSTEFSTTLGIASRSVKNASDSLGDIYKNLTANLSATYNALSGNINSIGRAVSLLEPNVSAAVSSALQAAQTNVSATRKKFQDYATGLVNKVILDGKAQVKLERNITNANMVAFKAMLNSAINKTSVIMNQVKNATESQQANQAAIASALDQMVKTLSSVSGGNSALLLRIQSQFQNLKSSTGGLADSLNKSLSTALQSASVSAAQAEADAKKKVEITAGESAAAMTDLGQKLNFALSVLNSGSKSDIKSLGQSDAEVLKLAQSVEALGSGTSKRVQEVLSKILSGQTTVADVLSASANMRIANLKSVEGVMAAFTKSVNDFMTQTSLMYNDEIKKLETFNATVPAVLAQYQTGRALALTAAQSLVDQANLTAQNYNKTEQNLITDTNAAITQANFQLGNMTLSIPAQIADIKKAIVSAVESVETSQDAVAKSLITATQDAKSTVVNKLRNFRTQKKKPKYSLDVENVALPTQAPLIEVKI